MSECTFISKIFAFTIAALLFFSGGSYSYAQSPSAGPNSTEAPQIPLNTATASSPENQPAIPPGAESKKDEPGMFDQASPYLDYGDFNLSDNEEAESLFYQYGRFFGLSLGAGYQTATGNRGKLYNAAFPRVDVKVHYWFDFQTALNFGLMFANHSYLYNDLNYKVAIIGFLVDLKYYFDVRNAGAALSFANPYLIGGAGALSKTQSALNSTPDTDSTFSVGGGAGLEFPIVHKSTYFCLEARYFTQSFNDTAETKFNASRDIEDLSGGFYTIMGHLLFTW